VRQARLIIIIISIRPNITVRDRVRGRVRGTVTVRSYVRFAVGEWGWGWVRDRVRVRSVVRGWADSNNDRSYQTQ